MKFCNINFALLTAAFVAITMPHPVVTFQRAAAVRVKRAAFGVAVFGMKIAGTERIFTAAFQTAATFRKKRTTFASMAVTKRV